jgi:hypothetical protein
VRISLAVFVAFLAIGRISAPAGGGGEAVPFAAPAQTGFAAAIPARLTGPPPLELALSERTAAERAGLASASAKSVRRAGPATPAVTTVVAQSAQPPAAVEALAGASAPGAPAGASAPAQPVGARAPRPSTPTPAPIHTSSGPSAGVGGSFDSSG